MDYNKVAKDILDNVGGKANVKQVTVVLLRVLPRESRLTVNCSWRIPTRGF